MSKLNKDYLLNKCTKCKKSEEYLYAKEEANKHLDFYCESCYNKKYNQDIESTYRPIENKLKGDGNEQE